MQPTRIRGPWATGRDLHACRKDGSTFSVEISLSYVRDEHGLKVMAFVVDITERKQAEATIQKYQQRLQDMAFDLALARQRESRRIAVELHDRLGQDLALAQIKLAGFRKELEAKPADTGLDEGINLVEQAIESTRTLTFELCPPILYDLGLDAAVASLADEMYEQRGFRIELEADDAAGVVRGEQACLLFRIVRELLMNASKYAKTHRAVVRLEQRDDRLEITVADEGVGFEPAKVIDREADHHGFGLFSIREQVERLKGEMRIDAAPGRGTRVQIDVPATTSPLISESNE